MADSGSGAQAGGGCAGGRSTCAHLVRAELCTLALLLAKAGWAHEAAVAILANRNVLVVLALGRLGLALDARALAQLAPLNTRGAKRVTMTTDVLVADGDLLCTSAALHVVLFFDVLRYGGIIAVPAAV